MTNQIDPQVLMQQADDLLADIKKANDDFVNKANVSIKNIAGNLQKMNELDRDLQQAEQEAMAELDAIIPQSPAEKN